MTYKPLPPKAVQDAYNRIFPHIRRTPNLHSDLLNSFLKHEIRFKIEGLQSTGAFKIRGALNTLLSLEEQHCLPKEIVTFSSGNHAQAVAWVGRKFGIKTTIFLPFFTSKIKQQATISYGAKVIYTASRSEAEERAAEMGNKSAYLIHPYDDDMVIAGQGTACLEALQEEFKPNAIFAPCGGGGLLSGTYLAAQLLSPASLIYAGEPSQANDATLSYRQGKIIRYKDSPDTIADGARALAISERTFHYLKKINGFYEVTESEILYWTQWLIHLLKVAVEPTSALAMGAAYKWIMEQTEPQKILVIISGGNIAPETYHTIWKENHLEKIPDCPKQVFLHI
ncbi:serine/threonine dehydratase [Legionella parisiensis]|uniref:L-threonine dehydratase catabolic TdcB n=1 Tax=Legionella parisiensis TaxID=45071 RepID=A0A1E5JUM7_9GAMM|nr:serine/threonine dehydratase [Legionella parisiensis]KTD43148.1 L-threonine dehydratase catabolic TdcB [Legionella parisiensis]OEH48254.1 L-threonine dehydratase catabolic TdcB [Legionella parisiensis]STX77772.1 L-threonine dehydratase catabolic TdcB [Legionella parisiensis]